MRLRILFLIVLVAWSEAASAQTLVGDRLRLNTGPCTLSSGVGSPEGVLVGKPCDFYIDTTNGVLWAKWTGTSSNGWVVGHNANARVNGTLDVTGYVGQPGFVSQLTGWRIDALGAADFRYVYTDELHAKSFVADLEQALAGGQIICKSVALLASNFTNPATGATAALTVKDLPSAENMAVFESGDWVGLRSFSRASGSLTIAETFGTVSAYADQPGGVQTWNFTRGIGVNGGSLSAAAVIATDAVVIDYGVSGNGCHEISAIDGIYGINSPYAQTWTWSGSPISINRVVRSRLGNLRGITGTTGEFGVIAGTYAASNGQFFRGSNTAFELHGINLLMWEGGANTIKLDRTAPSFALGSPVPSAYGTGTGIWMGKDGSTYKFRVGDPAGQRMTFDGTTLTLVGDGGGVTNINGGNIQTDSITATQIAADTITAGEIAADTITATEIAANAITTSELNADSVTSVKIVAGTIVASDIAAGTITADRLNVTTLSAITANLGTITAGHIDGATAEFGGIVDLDSSGIEIATGGPGSNNGYKFTNGFGLFYTSNNLYLYNDDGDFIFAGVGGNHVGPDTVGIDLGTSGIRWDDIWAETIDLSGSAVVDGNLFLGGDLDWTPPTTTADDQPLVYSVSNGIIYRKTNGLTGTSCSSTGIFSINWDRGIAVSVTCN